MLRFPLATAYGTGANTAYRISVNGKPLFNIIADDLDPADGLSLQQSASNVVERLNQLRRNYLQEHSSGALAIAFGYGIAGTVVFVGMLYLALRLRRHALRRLPLHPDKLPGWIRGG
jgi:hypothetical protein